MKRSRGRSTIRFQLTCLVMACVLPVWLAAGYLVYHGYRAKVSQVNTGMLESARAMTMVVDRELSGVQAALVALATSPSFGAGDFQGIHRQCRELLKSYPGADIIVADAAGQQLVNSFRNFGTPLPKRNNQQIVAKIFTTGRPVVSNLFFGALTRRPVIAIDVPVFLEGKVAYDLSMTFPSERMAAILAQRNLPKGWFASILDARRVIVARTLNPERFVGQEASPGARNALSVTGEGTAEFTNSAGVPIFASFSQSSLCGWTVVVGVPKALVLKEILAFMGWAVGGASALFLVGIVLALVLAGRIARSIQSLVGPASAIGRGETVVALGEHWVMETVEVGEALVQASDLLLRRSQERDSAQSGLSESLEKLQAETAERLKALESVCERDRLLIQQSRQAAMGEMIGNIAHQWRQPLNALGLLVQQVPLFFETGGVTQEFLDDNARKSLEIVQHMSRTIDDFRNYFKPDKEKVEFRLRGAVDQTLSLMEGSFSGHDIAIAVVEKGDPVITGYPNEFSQVLLNILINARDALVERQVSRPRVVIGIGVEGNRAVVSVRDNAGGISEEIIGKIFEPYFTTKGPQVGTGVGLFMSKNIIEKNMGGVLSVRNFEEGAEFEIRI